MVRRELDNETPGEKGVYRKFGPDSLHRRVTHTHTRSQKKSKQTLILRKLEEAHITLTHKKCTFCKRDMDISCFHLHWKPKRGYCYRSECKKCGRARASILYARKKKRKLDSYAFSNLDSIRESTERRKLVNKKWLSKPRQYNQRPKPADDPYWKVMRDKDFYLD